MKKIATVLVVVKDGKVLLGMKKRGFGEGHAGGMWDQAERDFEKRNN